MPNTPGTPAFPGALNDAVSLLGSANRVETTITGSISAGATALTLASATGWPASGPITFGDTGEIAYYTSLIGTAMSEILRGQDSTSAASHSAGVTVSLNVIARHHSVLSSAIQAVEAKLGIGASTPAAGQFLRSSGTGVSGWATAAVTDLSTYSSVSGTGSTALKTTMTSLTTGDILSWSGSNWINSPATFGSLSAFNVRDYGAVGDGVADDLAAIEAADADAAVEGGVVFFPPGVYGITDKYEPSEGVTVRGSGPYSSFIKALTAFPGSTAAITVVVDNVTVGHLGFTANANVITGVLFEAANHGRVEHCFFPPGWRWAVFIGNVGVPSSFITVDDIRCTGSVVTGEILAIVDSSYVTIKNSYVKMTIGRPGIEVFSQTAGATHDCKILNNVWEGGTEGVSCNSDVGCVVHGNHFFGQSLNAIFVAEAVDDDDYETLSGTITGNVIDGGSLTDAGINIVGRSKNWTVAGNTIRNSTGKGIVVSGTENTITGNTVRDTVGRGIEVNSDYNQITGNVVTGGGTHGIVIAADHNNIVGNTCTGNVGQGLNFAVGASNNSYGGNILEGNTAGTVFDSGSANALNAIAISGGAGPSAHVALNGAQEGFVGIGTTSPTAALTVTAPSGFNTHWKDGTTTGFVFVSSGLEIGTSSNHNVSLDTNSISRLRVGAAGGVTIVGASGSLTVEGTTLTLGNAQLLTNQLTLAGTTILRGSATDGVATLFNAAASGWTRLNLGGVTNAFPSIGRSSTTIALQLADGSGTGCPFTAASGVLTGDFTAGGLLKAGSSATVLTSSTGSILSAALEGGSASPGNSRYYGTNSVGTKGFFPISPFTVKTLTADVMNSTVTAAKLTTLDTVVAPGTWKFEYLVRYQAAATTTGVKFSVNHTGTLTSFVANMRYVDVSATASTGAPSQAANASTAQVMGAYSARVKSALADMGPTLSVDSANSDMLLIIEGLMVVTVSGNIELYHASEVAAASTVKQNTALILTQVL